MSLLYRIAVMLFGACLLVACAAVPSENDGTAANGDVVDAAAERLTGATRAGRCESYRLLKTTGASIAEIWGASVDPRVAATLDLAMIVRCGFEPSDVQPKDAVEATDSG